MWVTIIPIVIGTFGTVTKRLLKGLEELEAGGRVEIIQMLYSHDQLYKHMCICMQNLNDDTIKTSDTVF